MELTLSATETDLLVNVLNRFVADLREEIGKTENFPMRQDLKHDEAALKAIISRLSAVQAR